MAGPVAAMSDQLWDDYKKIIIIMVKSVDHDDNYCNSSLVKTESYCIYSLFIYL